MATTNATRASSSEVLDRLQQLKIVPVIVIDDAADAVPMAQALTKGGLSCAEITFRTAAAPEALRRITGEHPEMFAGAGTVLTPEQAADARAAGAQFMVAPGFSPAVVDYCLEHEIPVFPGVCTPTEIVMALGKGLTTVKFFPAEPAGGVNYLKAIAAPYGMMRFIPTGGVNATNIANYLAWKSGIACGGSWMAPSEWMAAKQFDRIRNATAQAVAAVAAVRGEQA
jgi:2-dehydro-3-deoxyphosphogluconate aldolase/(4S)-4-hydroxy-2-oxoglutarate aldolase